MEYFSREYFGNKKLVLRELLGGSMGLSRSSLFVWEKRAIRIYEVEL